MDNLYRPGQIHLFGTKTLSYVLAVAIAAALLNTTAAAQSGVVVDYRLDVFDMTIDPGGAGVPIKSGTIPATALVCNQVEPIAITLTIPNPHRVYWPDRANTGKVCIAPTSLSLWFDSNDPAHTYTVTITPVDDRGLVGPRSAASMTPFEIRAPDAIVGVKLAR